MNLDENRIEHTEVVNGKRFGEAYVKKSDNGRKMRS